jgi:hypothetical protein
MVTGQVCERCNTGWMNDLEVAAKPILMPMIDAVAPVRRLLDLILRAVDPNLLYVVIDALDHTGGQHHLLAEDPRAGVDDDVALPHVVARLVDLADRAVDGFDLMTGEIAPGGRVVAQLRIRPKVPNV